MISAPQESVVVELDRSRFDAIVEERWDDFAAMCHPELRYVHATGVVDTCNSYLEKLRGGHYDYRWIRSSIDSTWSSGGTVLVWGTMHAELRAGDVVKTIDNRILTVWVEHDAQWKLIAQQPTPVGPSVDVGEAS